MRCCDPAETRALRVHPRRKALLTFLVFAALAAANVAAALGALRTLREIDGAAQFIDVGASLRAELASHRGAAELDRLGGALRTAMKAVQVECRRTDEGQPWCTVRDENDRDRVLVHVARAEHAYILLWPQDGRWERVQEVRPPVELASPGEAAAAPPA
jgi:hypothetical protein